jgi:carboxypeptidase Taq
MSFQKLDDLCRQMSALDHAQSMLGADEATHMAPGGGGDRADAMARLAGMTHRMTTASEVGDWLDAATDGGDGEKAAALREFGRVRAARMALPAEFVEKQMAARLRSEQLWRTLRPSGNWKSFLPSLANVIGLAREEAAMRAAQSGLDPYDALIEQHDPGTRAAAIEPHFARLKQFLGEFLPVALAAQKRRRAKLSRRGELKRAGKTNYSIEGQRQLGLAAMAATGFDFTHGSLSVSHHPFCGGVPSDVRITTRYRDDDFLSSFMAILHETGHALYEQGLPAKWAHWPNGKARGMAMHESQSLFVEKQIGRNPAFWRFALPLVKKHLKLDWSRARAVYEAQKVTRGFIRTEADEVTYPLHVILRFELERDLFAGRLRPADIPEAWDARMQAYLGLTTLDNPKDGPMQDVHWPAGVFGYFPSYTLGAALAAQQWAAVARKHRDIEDDLAAGRFTRLNRWRRDKIWRKASMHSADRIMKAATGSTLDVEPFIAHLKMRYAD